MTARSLETVYLSDESLHKRKNISTSNIETLVDNLGTNKVRTEMCFHLRVNP
jgi:hypothetical protein